MKKTLICMFVILSLLTALSACGQSGADTAARSDGLNAVKEAAGAAIAVEEAAGAAAAAEEEEPVGGVISFVTTDLAGNEVRSEDVFGGNTLTMVNLWGTYCGPCIGEMPDLEVLNARLRDKGCGIVGVVCDVWDAGDSYTIGTAEAIIADTGVTYLNLIPWDSFAEDFPAEFIPTTYFVDEKGNKEKLKKKGE